MFNPVGEITPHRRITRTEYFYIMTMQGHLYRFYSPKGHVNMKPDPVILSKRYKYITCKPTRHRSYLLLTKHSKRTTVIHKYN